MSPALLRIYLEDALVSTARAQRDPSDAHRALATRRAIRLRQVGGAAAVPAVDFEQAMASAAATVELDDEGGCFCGHCGQRAVA